MPINNTAKEVSKLLARRAKLAKLVQHYMGQIVEMDAELCACMTTAVQSFGAAAGLDPDYVIEPKE